MTDGVIALFMALLEEVYEPEERGNMTKLLNPKIIRMLRIDKKDEVIKEEYK